METSGHFPPRFDCAVCQIWSCDVSESAVLYQSWNGFKTIIHESNRRVKIYFTGKVEQ